MVNVGSGFTYRTVVEPRTLLNLRNRVLSYCIEKYGFNFRMENKLDSNNRIMLVANPTNTIVLNGLNKDGRILNYTLDKRSDIKNHHVLAVGNPDLGDPLLDLPFAEHEVDSIKWNFPNIALLTNEKATESWVAENIEKFGIIHLASHGEFDPVNPLFSAIKLSGSKEIEM